MDSEERFWFCLCAGDPEADWIEIRPFLSSVPVCPRCLNTAKPLTDGKVQFSRTYCPPELRAVLERQEVEEKFRNALESASDPD
jgi:hypothetical protein